ncbi:MAG: hypothetical protein CL897_03460 [Dehalococcoidia bacterium]|nr:hypothetical protein [Dehalococcoidia bacterium]
MRVTARRTVRRRLMGSRTIRIEDARPVRPFGSGGMRILVGFGLILALATALLALPIASNGDGATVLEASFTSISAICVTGLVVVDTQTQWSTFGEVVILGVIQLGGLGYLAGMGIVLWVLGRNLGLRDRNLMRIYYGAPTMSESLSFVRTILIYTFVIEALGILALFGGFVSAGVPIGRSIWWAVFHAISAFNVAGFNVTGEDMRPFSDDPTVLLPLIVLCLAGSLGAVPIILGILRLDIRRMPLDAKVVLSTAAVVIAGSALFIGISEWANSGTLGTVAESDRPLLAFFQAAMWVSGFSGVETGLLNDHTKLFESVLMLIGGAAGTPAGGLKLGTLAVLVIATVATLRGRDEVIVFGRRLPHNVIRQAVGITFLFAALHFVVAILLLRTTDHQFIDVLFEASSALGTVGWSTGITTNLGTTATFIVMVTMLIGRFLPLLLVLQIARPRKQPVGNQLRDNVRLG